MKRAWVVLSVLALVAIACGDGAGDGIDEQDPGLVAKGAEPYEVSCAECHGSDLRGTDSGPSHLSIVYQPSQHGDGAFQIAVLIGSTAHH